MAQLDDFTLNLLTNDEVLEVNQDPLGKQARRVTQADNLEVWAKEMEDGSLAVGLFNRGGSRKQSRRQLVRPGTHPANRSSATCGGKKTSASSKISSPQTSPGTAWSSSASAPRENKQNKEALCIPYLFTAGIGYNKMRPTW